MDPVIASIFPAPNEEEAAAIAAAAVMLWPQPAAAAPPATRSNVGWRFSGRWWATDAITRRERP